MEIEGRIEGVAKNMESKSAEVNLPIDRVSILEDRAKVERRGKVEIGSGLTILRVEKVSPVIWDKSLLVRVEGEGDGPVKDVKVLRKPLALREELPEKEAALKEEIRCLQEELGSLESEQERLGDLLALWDQSYSLTIDDLVGDVRFAREPDEALLASLQELEDEQLEKQRRQVELEFEEEKKREKLRDLEQQFNALRTPSSSCRADLEIEVYSEYPRSLELLCVYLVGAAAWRPRHRAFWAGECGEEALLRFETEACVWQNSGEDWDDVKLFFSTERASLGYEAPRLHSDLVEIREKSADERVELREEEIATLGLGKAQGDEASDRQVFGIEDGGEVKELEGPDRASIPSDGKPYRLALFSFQSKVEWGRRLMAELSPMVFRWTRCLNESSQALLPGPVELIYQGGILARSKISYVAPKERFELNWGPDPELRVHRYDHRREKEASMLSSWVDVEHDVVIKLSNLSVREKSLVVKERIPVSEVEKVKLHFKGCQSEKKPSGPDENGMLRWELKLSAFAHETLDFHYLL